jgi:hypothetical protein
MGIGSGPPFSGNGKAIYYRGLFETVTTGSRVRLSNFSGNDPDMLFERAWSEFRPITSPNKRRGVYAP